MGWDFLDDIQEQAEDAFGTFTEGALKSGLESIGWVTTGQPQKGNQTADQIANGQNGAPITTIIQSRSMGMEGLGKFSPILIIGALIGFAFLLRR